MWTVPLKAFSGISVVCAYWCGEVCACVLYHSSGVICIPKLWHHPIPVWTPKWRVNKKLESSITWIIYDRLYGGVETQTSVIKACKSKY